MVRTLNKLVLITVFKVSTLSADLGPNSQSFLVQRVAPSDKILGKILRISPLS